MRNLFLFIAWTSLVGNILDGLLILYIFGVVLVYPEAYLTISIDTLFKDYIGVLYPIKQLIYVILPDGFVTWVFSLKALFLFPIRIVLSTTIGVWAFRMADKYQ